MGLLNIELCCAYCDLKIARPSQRSRKTSPNGKLVEHFKKNTGEDYVSYLMAADIASQAPTKRFFAWLKNAYQNRITNAQGNVDNLKELKIPQKVLPIYNSMSNPIDFQYYVIVDGVKQVDIHEANLHINKERRHYEADLIIYFIDTFGVDEKDASVDNKSLLHTYFPRQPIMAFWILQHQRGYNPFKNIIPVKLHVQGYY